MPPEFQAEWGATAQRLKDMAATAVAFGAAPQTAAAAGAGHGSGRKFSRPSQLGREIANFYE